MTSHGEGEVPGLAAGRLWAASHFPYLASGLFGAQVLARPGIGTLAVDGGWRLHADPELTAGWTPAQLGSVLVHHVSHLLRAHGERAAAAGIGPDDARAWVRGADAEINDDLVPAGLELPGQPVLPGHLGAEEGLLAEQIFAAGRAGGGARDGTGGVASGGRDTTDRGLGSGLRQRRGRPGPRLGRLRNGRRCLPGRRGCSAVRWPRTASGASGRPGTCPPGCCAGPSRPSSPRWTGGGYSPRNCAGRWRTRPARWTTPTGAPPGVPQSPAPVVLPALRRPVPEVAVVCDTSGSMTEDLLAAALAEVEGLLRSLGLARQVRVLACDTAVGVVRRVTSARRVELASGGGTDMGAGIEAAAALRPRPAVTVVLTDGFTPWPDRPPRGSRVVVALLGDEAPDGPGWARSVRVPTAAA